MRAETVDWVMLSFAAASMKLPVSATIKNVRARLMSMRRFASLRAYESYLSKSSIAVTGNFRLKRGLILTTLRTGSTRVESDSAQLQAERSMEGLTKMAKAAKKPAKKAAKKPAAKKKK